MNFRIYLFVIIIGVFTVPQNVLAQRKAYKVQKKQKNNYEAYPNPFDFRPSGWLFDVGLTATTGLTGEKTLSFNDTTLTLSAPLRPGVVLKIGRYQSLKKGHKIFKYIDYSLGYKLLWNTEEQTREIAKGNISETFTNQNLAHYVNLNLNFNNIISLNDYNFIQNTIGINADYRFINSLSGEGTNVAVQPDNFIVQLHYKFALGLMIDNDKVVIPYIEIPLFNITPQQSNFSQLDYFNGSYQTFIVGVRLMLFRLGQKNCPTAKGTTVDPNKQNGY